MKRSKAPKKVVKKRAPRTPPYPNYPAWSTSRFYGFLRSALRSAYNRYPPKWEVLKQASRPYSGPDKRKKTEYQCAICSNWYSSKDISVDHIIPAGSLLSLEDLPGFCARLFCSKEDLRVLCNPCHAVVTLAQRRANKDSEVNDED